MTDNPTQPAMTRRGFLKAVAATAAAATTVGTGAAVWYEANRPAASLPVQLPTMTSTPAGTLPTPAAPGLAVEEWAALQGQNLHLQLELETARQQLAALTQTQLEQQGLLQTTQAELAAAQEYAAALSGLVTLYEQLEQTDIGQVVLGGLSAVGLTLADLLDDWPSLAEGVAAGEAALSQLESDIPMLESGRRWLVAYLGRVGAYLAQVEQALAAALEKVEPFLVALGQWFEDVLSWLPFGLGARAAAVTSALTDLLAEAPSALVEAQIRLIAPLERWLGPEGEQNPPPLVSQVIHPLRQQALRPAQSVMTKGETLAHSYHTQLRLPAEQLLPLRQAVRDQIAAYREAHQL